MVTYITEEEFRYRVDKWCSAVVECNYKPWAVTGPGRSGAIAAVYISHRLHVPFVPFGVKLPPKRGLLIADTALNSGRTMRRAMRKYRNNDPNPVWFYNEPPRVKFWYESWEDG